MDAAWACAVDRAAGVADSTRRFLLSFRRPPPPTPATNPIDILKRLQRQAFYDIMQLRERQEKVEKVLTLFKSSKIGPFAEESTRVKGLVSFAGALALRNKEGAAPDASEANSGISSQFLFQTTVRKDSLIGELSTDPRCLSQENDLVGSPLVLSKVMYLANVSNNFSVAAVPVGARCDDFSTDPSIREGHWLPSFRSSLRPPLLRRRHNHAAGLILKTPNFAASLAELITTAVKSSSGEASSVFTGLGQISCRMHDEMKLTMSAAWHGPSVISRKSKPAAGGCVDIELKLDDDSRIGAWVEVKRSNSRQLKWAVALSDTPDDDLGWGVSVRRGCSKGAPERIQLEGFLSLHLGEKATLQPGLVFNLDGRRCAPAFVLQSSWFL